MLGSGLFAVRGTGFSILLRRGQALEEGIDIRLSRWCSTAGGAMRCNLTERLLRLPDVLQ